MAKKKANSFVLTIAGITAATVIGVVGVKLTPAPVSYTHLDVYKRQL